MDIEPETDREIMIAMSHDIKEMSNAVKQLAEAVKNIENTKIGEINERIRVLEKFMNSFEGSYKILIIITTVVSALSALYVALKH